MSPEEDFEQLSPAERRLDEHLTMLRGAPQAPPSLLLDIVRKARWQRAVRSPLLTITHLAAAMSETIRLLIGGKRT